MKLLVVEQNELVSKIFKKIFDEKQYAIIGQSTKNMIQLGDEVTVKVKHTDLERKHLDFSLVTE